MDVDYDELARAEAWANEQYPEATRVRAQLAHGVCVEVWTNDHAKVVVPPEAVLS